MRLEFEMDKGDHCSISSVQLCWLLLTSVTTLPLDRAPLPSPALPQTSLFLPVVLILYQSLFNSTGLGRWLSEGLVTGSTLDSWWLTCELRWTDGDGSVGLAGHPV